jgi:hypothetical protein
MSARISPLGNAGCLAAGADHALRRPSRVAGQYWLGGAPGHNRAGRRGRRTQVLELCCVVMVMCLDMLYCAVLCCAVLCCAVMCCAVLCCAVLCCAVLAAETSAAQHQALLCPRGRLTPPPPRHTHTQTRAAHKHLLVQLWLWPLGQARSCPSGVRVTPGCPPPQEQGAGRAAIGLSRSLKRKCLRSTRSPSLVRRGRRIWSSRATM